MPLPRIHGGNPGKHTWLGNAQPGVDVLFACILRSVLRHAEDQWLHVPHPPLLQLPQLLLPREPTNRDPPLKAKAENCLVTLPLSHSGQCTRLRLELTSFSKACPHCSQTNS